MVKYQSEQQICFSTSIFCIVRKMWPYPPTPTRGSYRREAGLTQAGRQKKMGGFQKMLTFLQVKLFGLLLCLISFCNFTTVLELHSVGFHQVEVYFKVFFEVPKFGSHFLCQSLLLVTNVPNDSHS